MMPTNTQTSPAQVGINRARIAQAIDTILAGQAPDTQVCAYIYDLQGLEAHARHLVAALPDNCEFYYAAKANPEARILATLAPVVHGFEAASGGELDWLHACHPEMPLIFGGPGKLISELSRAIDLGIEAIHVESLTELRRLAALCAQKQASCRILLRMNISLEGIAQTRLTMGGKPTPFGIDAEDLGAAIDIIAAAPQLTLAGFHFHLMSHQLDVQRHLALIALYFATFKRWCREYCLDLGLLNVGGGIGVDYANPEQVFDWPAFCAGLARLIEEAQLTGVKIRFECGRFVTAAAGCYVMEVLDIKKNHGEWFVIAHGGTHHFRTPAAQNHDHPFMVLPGVRRRQSTETEGDDTRLVRQQATLVGQLCTPKDVLARRQHIEALQLGDYLVFTHAGAYAWNISHQHFLMHAPPVMHFIES
ncbi:type III PLP-dependent enzyme [Shewanella salipaludis]|nr:type III PLP-dependent enzyme [Shewanella salipaludis]